MCSALLISLSLVFQFECAGSESLHLFVALGGFPKKHLCSNKRYVNAAHGTLLSLCGLMFSVMSDMLGGCVEPLLGARHVFFRGVCALMLLGKLASPSLFDMNNCGI